MQFSSLFVTCYGDTGLFWKDCRAARWGFTGGKVMSLLLLAHYNVLFIERYQSVHRIAKKNTFFIQTV